MTKTKETNTIENKLPEDIASRIDDTQVKYQGEIYNTLDLLPAGLRGTKDMQTAYINNGEIDEAINLGKLMRVGLLVDKEILNRKGKEILINISLSPDGLRVGLWEAISYAKKLGVDIYTDLKLMKEVLSEWIKDTRDGPSDITKFARSEFPNQTTKSNSPYGGKIALKVNPNQVWFQEHDWFKNEEGEWFKEMKKEGSKFIIVLPKDSAWKLFADCPAADQNLKENKVTLIDLSK
ncbi:MAG: hypothetical protein NTY80_02375 [candidate division SR1 bacterium]|nr:hypothetical protein [candidate division SR1 bacterium]